VLELTPALDDLGNYLQLLGMWSFFSLSTPPTSFLSAFSEATHAQFRPPHLAGINWCFAMSKIQVGPNCHYEFCTKITAVIMMMSSHRPATTLQNLVVHAFVFNGES